MANDEASRPITLRLPCAVLRVWRVGESGDEGDLADSEEAPAGVAEYLLRHPGVYRVGAALFAVTAVPGDAAAFDAALAWSEAVRREDPASGGLIVPGVLRRSTNERAELELDLVTGELAGALPELEPGSYLTTRAHQTLEYAVESRHGATFKSPAGATFPLVRAESPRFDQPPWRNREILGQPSVWVERTEAARLGEALDEPILRVTGPAGAGKTRLLWETLNGTKAPRLWLTVRPERLPTPTLAEQILRLLLLPTLEQEADPSHPKLAAEVDRAQIREALENRRGRGSRRENELLNERAQAALRHLPKPGDTPLRVIVDDYHALDGNDGNFVREVLAAQVGNQMRLILVGRPGADWRGLDYAPAFEVGPLGDNALGRLSAQLTEGFALPDPLTQRFLESVGGSPFALEEGLFGMVHDRTLRRVYGSFFFAGDPKRDFFPSQRFVRHTEAEIGRLSDVWPARFLSLVDVAAPATEIAQAASSPSRRVAAEWHLPLIEASLLATAESPWDGSRSEGNRRDGITFIREATRRALQMGFPAEEARRLQQRLGRILSDQSGSAEASWRAYRLLSGKPEATSTLLQVFADKNLKGIEDEELLEALTRELKALRERSSQKEDDEGDPEADAETELEILWRTLPLARRLGKLHNYRKDLKRAVLLGEANPRRLLALASIKAEMEHEDGRHKEAEATIKQVLEATPTVEPARKAVLLLQLGRLFIRQRRHDEARQLFRSVSEAAAASESPGLAATCGFYLGNIALSEGNLDEAREHHLEALAERERHRLTRPAGLSLSALGAVSVARGNFPEALDYYKSAEEVLSEHGREGEIAFVLLGKARALARLGDYTKASRPVRQALELRQGRDDTAGEALARLEVAQNYLDIGHPEEALEQARQAHFQLSLISADEHVAAAEALLGRIHLSQRRYDAAKRRFEAARAAHEKASDTQEAAFDVSGLLKIAVETDATQAVKDRTADLRNALAELPRSDSSDTLAFRLYRGLDYLSSMGLKVGDPLAYLERAYAGVLEKAGHLSHEQRQRYLFQIPDNQAILTAATEKGLAAPA